jgi:hypothetical protein
MRTVQAIHLRGAISPWRLATRLQDCSRFKRMFCSAEERAQSPRHPAHHQNGKHQQYRNNTGGPIGLPGCEPGEEYGQRIFAEAERDIRERLGRWSYGGARSDLAAMCSQGDQAAGECSYKLLGGRQSGRGAIGEERGDRNADKRMQRIPDQVEGGNLIGEKLDREERAAAGNHIPTRQKLQRSRERQPSSMGQQAQRGHGRVHVQASCKADGHQQGY